MQSMSAPCRKLVRAASLCSTRFRRVMFVHSSSRRGRYVVRVSSPNATLRRKAQRLKDSGTIKGFAEQPAGPVGPEPAFDVENAGDS